MTSGEDMRALRVFIGPVQGFIASGRRTRDYWAGSFLLSRLAGEAMVYVEKQGGKITVPVVDGAKREPTFAAIKAANYAWDDSKEQNGPLVGTLVNHFRAEVPAGFGVQEMIAAVRGRLGRVAAAVWEHYIEPAVKAAEGDESGKFNEIKARWNEQVSGDFFEVLAVLGDDEDSSAGWREESRWLDRRKLYRTHFPRASDPRTDRTPDRCPVHPEFCELGGYNRGQERERQDAFWNVVRETVGKRMYDRDPRHKREDEEEELRAALRDLGETGKQYRDTLELREGERLSGFALVKRLFPLLPPSLLVKAIGWVPDHMFFVDDAEREFNPDAAHRALRNWPSTAFVAAIPWIVQAGTNEPQQSSDYALKQYNRLGVGPILEAERPQDHRIRGIDKLTKVMRRGKMMLPQFTVLDGTLHFERGLEKHRFDRNLTRQDANDLADELAATFKTFSKQICAVTTKNDQLIARRPASTHYAMLDMDGDNMGRSFSESRDKAIDASRKLHDFANGVPRIVRACDGVLIYSGADDVNAMLPIETAIACARAIREHWRNMFGKPSENNPDVPTLSGSIVLADYQNALDDVRKLTHERLDRIAKDGMGRDALALAVMKSGGVVSEWASRWEDESGDSVVDALFDYARDAGSGKDRTIASRLPYVFRDRLQLVLDAKRGDGGDLFDHGKLVKFLAKEIGDSGLSGGGQPAMARALKVAHMIRPWRQRRHAAGKLTTEPAARHIGGLLIARFLADNALWDYHRDWLDRETNNPEGGGS